MVRRVIAIRDGRTSTETLRHGSTPDGSEPGHAVEYAVLDRAGRLQLPREMTEALGMRDRVRLEAEPDHIGVWPDNPREPKGAPVPGLRSEELATSDEGRHRAKAPGGERDKQSDPAAGET